MAWRYHRSHFPDLFPPSNKMAVRRGSKANSTRSSFKLATFVPFNVSACGRPSWGPNSVSSSMTRPIAARSRASRSSLNHRSNSSVPSTFHTRVYYPPALVVTSSNDNSQYPSLCWLLAASASILTALALVSFRRSGDTHDGGRLRWVARSPYPRPDRVSEDLREFSAGGLDGGESD
jgi:hypothetical protein